MKDANKRPFKTTEVAEILYWAQGKV